jgi:lysophospholipase L1-like esterase
MHLRRSQPAQGDDSQPREDALQKLFVLGDSISMHYGPYLAEMLRGVLAYARKEPTSEPPPDLPYPADANGGDSSAALAYLRERLGSLDPDVLLVNCGLHDIKTDPHSGASQVSPDRYRANLREMAALVAAAGVRTFWVRTTPLDDATHNSRSVGFHRYHRDVIRYNEIADAVWKGAGIPIIDLYTFTCNVGPELYCDHVHLTMRVRELQAAYIAGSLLASL